MKNQAAANLQDGCELSSKTFALANKCQVLIHSRAAEKFGFDYLELETPKEAEWVAMMLRRAFRAGQMGAL